MTTLPIRSKPVVFVGTAAGAMTPVLDAVGIQRQERSGHVYLVGVKLAS